MNKPDDLILVSDDILYRNVDNYYTTSDYNGYLTRYLQSFVCLRLVIRVQEINLKRTDVHPLDSSDKVIVISSKRVVCFKRLSDLLNFYLIGRKHQSLTSPKLVRFPSFYGLAYIIGLNFTNYNLEVVADAETAYAKNWLIKFSFYKLQSLVIKLANDCSFVTEDYLQRKYIDKSFENNKSSYSSIYLNTSKLNSKVKNLVMNSTFKIINVTGSAKTFLKGHKELFSIAIELNNKEVDFILKVIGSGRAIKWLIKEVKKNGMDNRFVFIPFLTPNELALEYQRANLFLYTSHSEGLPRVLIEAMANGLPVVSSNVGGIPELIPSKYLFDLSDINGFVTTIVRLSRNTLEYNRYSNYSLTKANTYDYKIVNNKASIYYDKIKDVY